MQKHLKFINPDKISQNMYLMGLTFGSKQAIVYPISTAKSEGPKKQAEHINFKSRFTEK